jgi:multicomponent Na+:H+ antiporter subunit E
VTGLPPPAAPPRRARLGLTRAFLAHWAMLMAFWIVLSGSFDPLHLGAGVICAALVASLTYEMEFVDRAKSALGGFHLAPVPWHRLALYSVWLLREIAVANWQVMKIVMSPRLPIDPAIVRFRTGLTTDLGRTVLANSITLTPGTITVQVSDDEFLVHALKVGPGIANHITRIQRQVARALPRLETIVEPEP